MRLLSHNIYGSYTWVDDFMRPPHKIPFNYFMDILDYKSLNLPIRLLREKVQSMYTNSSLLNK